MLLSEAKEIFKNVQGTRFASIDTVTLPALKKPKSNPYTGRVTKHVTCTIALSSDKTGSSYAKAVTRALEKEEKDTAKFELKERKWGTRIKDTPFIEHTKKGATETTYYLEARCLNVTSTQYYLDGEKITKEHAIDVCNMTVPRVDANSQGGLDEKIIIRDYALNSIKTVRIDNKEYTF